MPPVQFTYPFCYVPDEEIKEAASALSKHITDTPYLQKLFQEGKMMGILWAEKPDGTTTFLYSFSGSVLGHGKIEGFVPPIFDLTEPGGFYRAKEKEITELNRLWNEFPERRKEIEEERKTKSAALQDWIFDQYVVHNAKGEELTVRQVFAMRGIVPPGGTGDCAAPKLLEYAYRNGLKPLAMGEFWYGDSPAREVRHHGMFYPACTGKCGPLLTWMMQGLDIEENPLEKGFPVNSEIEVLYEDEAIVVVDKPSGMLSVPGRTEAVSLLEILRKTRPSLYSCHRLDMDTSGVMVFAKTEEIQANIEQQFENRQVSKSYTARLIAGDHPFKGRRKGTIALPIGPDWYDRPRQMVDPENGKKAITEYEILRTLPSGEMDVRFIPHTGRTHQLRVHAAHKDGLGHPIKGDRLYGCADGGRLHLHAETLSFFHPISGERVCYSHSIVAGGFEETS